MIPVIVFVSAVAVYFISGWTAFMFMDSSDAVSGTAYLINRLSIGVMVVALVWVLWVATGLTISVGS